VTTISGHRFATKTLRFCPSGECWMPPVRTHERPP